MLMTLFNKGFSVVFVLLAVSTTTIVFSDTRHSLDKIIATVDNNVITQRQLDMKYKEVINQLKHNNAPLPPEASLRRQLLDYLISSEIQLQRAMMFNITIDEKKITAVEKSFAKKNNLSLDKFHEQLRLDGITQKEFRQKIREELTIAKLQEMELTSHVHISEQEVTDTIKKLPSYQSEFLISDILISLSDTPSPEEIQKARQRALTLAKNIEKGSSFRKIAMEESEGSQALDGGDLGWRKLNELPHVFSKQIKKMKKGSISQPIRTPNGFHIIKLVDIREGLLKSKKAVRNEIREQIFRRKIEQERELWLRKIRGESYVHIHAPEYRAVS